jgi:hypothetical protein
MRVWIWNIEMDEDEDIRAQRNSPFAGNLLGNGVSRCAWVAYNEAREFALSIRGKQEAGKDSPGTSQPHMV